MRLKGLDVLRGVAILMVILRHGHLEDFALKEFGWLGVDLFFVISGVLVSGLLFKEYQEKGTINAKRFLIRRGFKIYPSFYFFILVDVLLHWYNTHTFYETKLLLQEMFYIQNYTNGIWWHTWSLDVEEHFYLVLAFCGFLVSGKRILYKKPVMIGSLIALLIISFLIRFEYAFTHRNEVPLFVTQTHLRADGLLVGVLLSYLLHFTNISNYISNRKLILFITGLLLLIPGLMYRGGSYEMSTFGLTMVNLGFGLITLIAVEPVAMSLYIKKVIQLPSEVLAAIGRNSYSIYLWHLTALSTVNYIFNFSKPINFMMYLIFALLLGTIMTYAIEKPFLRWRDKLTSKSA